MKWSGFEVEIKLGSTSIYYSNTFELRSWVEVQGLREPSWVYMHADHSWELHHRSRVSTREDDQRRQRKGERGVDKENSLV